MDFIVTLFGHGATDMNIQLEFNIENKTSEEMQISLMQKQVDQMCESMGKVRRKLFSEMGEMKRLYAELKQENEELKSILRELKNERTEWTYEKEGCLFDVQELKAAVG